MEQPELTSEGRLFAGVSAAFAGVAVLAAIDLASDFGSGISVRHVALEGALFLIGFFGATVVARRLVQSLRSARELRRETAALAERLKATEAEAARWQGEAAELVDGLAAAIDRQLDRWMLTAAEKEVALLLLKGLSHKEIAEARAVTEATTRQQARAVYKKSGLSGRHDLAAFFLEDLLLPRTPPAEGRKLDG